MNKQEMQQWIEKVTQQLKRGGFDSACALFGVSYPVPVPGGILLFAHRADRDALETPRNLHAINAAMVAAGNGVPFATLDIESLYGMVALELAAQMDTKQHAKN